MGEYGITAALFDAGFTIDTLMSKYGAVDWTDRSNWNCNDQVRCKTGTFMLTVPRGGRCRDEGSAALRCGVLWWVLR